MDGSLHLVYELTAPEKPGPVQKTLNVAPQGSFVVSVKNPDAPSPRGAGLPEGRKADFPASLQKLFGERRFADDPRLLDYEHAEVILIGARERFAKRYGMAPDAHAPEVPRALRELRMAKTRHPPEPLLQGRWA